MRDDVILQAARLRIGVATSEDLVRAAESALLAGSDAPSAAMLAGELDIVMERVRPRFEAMLSELSRSLPDQDEACWIVLRHHLRRVAERRVTPEAGVLALLEDVYYPAGLFERAERYVGDSHGLEHILGAHWSRDDLRERPDEVSFDGVWGAAALVALDEHIVRLAEEWVATHGAPTS